MPEEWRRVARVAVSTLELEHAQSLRVVRPELLHITVRFFGEVDEQHAMVLRTALQKAVLPVGLSLTLNKAGTFGSLARTNVIWLGVGGDLDGLCALSARVEEVAIKIGLASEKRKRRPHLTLARVRRQVGADERRTIAASVNSLNEPQASALVVRELVLMRSHLSVSGTRYESVASF